MSHIVDRYRRELIDLIYDNVFSEDILPSDMRSDASRFAKLKAKADAGNDHAQKRVCDAIYHGLLDQRHRSAKDRQADLEELVRGGNSYAERLLADSLFESAIDPRPRWSSGEDLARLQAIATGGSRANLYARELVNAVAGWAEVKRRPDAHESYIKQSKSDAQEFVELKAKAASGSTEESRDAWEKIIDAIYDGRLGQRKRRDADRFAELCALSSASDPIVRRLAKRKIGLALSNETLGQSGRSREERLLELKAMAVAGEDHIQYNRIKSLTKEPAKVLWLRYDFYNALVDGLHPEKLEANSDVPLHGMANGCLD